MALYQWSTTAASNATADPSINWQEGQAPSTVNDSARAMMAAVATWFQAPEWLNYGLAPAYVSATQYTAAGNQTGTYVVGRRVRAKVSAGMIYGTITASTYTSLTTVTVAWDSGVLDSGLSEVDVGMLNPAASSFPTGLSPTFAAITATGNITATGTITGSDITASSDERLKTDWEWLPDDFIERLAAVKSGTYTRIDIEGDRRHAGVSAQSLRRVLPEAVLEGAQGMLSVAYGNAALVACVELAKEVTSLRGELRQLRADAGL